MASIKNIGYTAKFIILIIGIMVSYIVYQVFWGSNCTINADTYYFYVPQKSAISEIADTLKKRGHIKSRMSLNFVAYLKEAPSVKAGMYELKKGWDNRQILNHFATHTPKATVFITIPATQSRNYAIKSLCAGTGVHPDDVWSKLNDKKYLKELGDYGKESVFSIFLPKNYRVYKNSTAEKLVERMHQEYKLFWNSSRLAKAEDMGLKPNEVIALSAIVYSETKRKEEMPIIAGVYLNRIQINMRLESDPTLIFASKKFGTQRVLFKDKNIESPYNTYRNKGLPPGPIYLVPGWVIDEVLEYDGHDYLYFCADHKLTGGHLFAETFEEHKENAQRYRERLDIEHIH